MILLNNFEKEYHYFQREVDREIKKTLKSGYYILGKNVENFENNFSKYIGTKYCIGVANGLEALQISLIVLGVKSGDEVITVANTAVATALAITNVGATPVFVDVDEYYHIDCNLIEAKVSKKTKAIIPVHLFGQMADMEKILKIAKKHRLKIIEDACQAHGASYKGKKAGSFGDTGAFSFYPTKNLGAYGDGGAITTNSKSLYLKCKMIRNYGQKNRYEHVVKGLNSRLDELQAAVLSVKLKKLDDLNKKRNKIAQIYYKNLEDQKGLVLPKVRKNSFHPYHLFVIQAKNRDKLHLYLKSKNIETIIHYPIPIHKQEAFKEFRRLRLTNTENLAKKILTLPASPFTSEKEIKTVCKEIKNFYEKSN